jgi:hypothetical protein
LLPLSSSLVVLLRRRQWQFNVVAFLLDVREEKKDDGNVSSFSFVVML